MHKPAGFKWISSKQQIFQFHKNLFSDVLKLTGKTKWALSQFSLLSIESRPARLENIYIYKKTKRKGRNVRGIDFQRGAEHLGELSL